MENLNAEQVKRGLECCANNDECVGEACPYYTTGCEKNMPKDALALINSQEQRIKELTEENERLHASCTELTQCCTKLETLYKIECRRVDTVKADTVRKMQERLKADAVTIQDHTGKLGVVVGVGNIDDVAREMLEGEK